ncbi:UDP-N-acetylmuramate dehydrogenase [Alteromonadaceae bacterium Bs31]|nr:UDP-N-acetylmuramate dehydrogenase [Alteromonadaceae bacterium Bs31]
MKLLKRVNLQPLNTMAVPSVAEHFVRAGSLDEVKEALLWAKNNVQPLHILGGGSNCLLPENISGLVLQPILRGVKLLESNERHYLVKVAAGENWNRFVHHCLSKGYFGLENLALIPGLVGAAPIQNIGAYGVELCDLFHSLEALEISTGTLRRFEKDECEFAYRHSVFKGRLSKQFIITSVTFRLFKHPELNVTYPALRAALAGIPRKAISPQIVAHTVMEIRRSKLPSPELLPNVGSFFKNPVVDMETIEHMEQLYPDLVSYEVDANHKKIPAGWLIEKAGWKGREEFNVKVHDQQALVIVNPNKMPVTKVLRLAKAIQANIKARFGIDLEQEPQLLL